MRYAALLLCLPCLACSGAAVKTGAQGVTTVAVVAVTAPVSIPAGVLGGLVAFFGWELIMLEDRAEEAEEENDDLVDQMLGLTDKDKAGILQPVYDLFWNILYLIAAYFGIKFIWKWKFASKKDARRLEEFEDRLITKIKDGDIL